MPVQYFQSVIAIELAVAGALLWQMHFFESRDDARRSSEHLPDSRLRVGLAFVLGATLFGSLWAMADEGPKWAAVAVAAPLSWTRHDSPDRGGLDAASPREGRSEVTRRARCLELVPCGSESVARGDTCCRHSVVTGLCDRR